MVAYLQYRFGDIKWLSQVAFSYLTLLAYSRLPSEIHLSGFAKYGSIFTTWSIQEVNGK